MVLLDGADIEFTPEAKGDTVVLLLSTIHRRAEGLSWPIRYKYSRRDYAGHHGFRRWSAFGKSPIDRHRPICEA